MRKTGRVTDAVELVGWSHTYSGKVRDLYESAEHPGAVLMVASDRVSAFDHVLEPGIPGKGALLTQLTLWWLKQLRVANHLVQPQPAGLSANATLARKLEMYPIECVVRGYLTGSGWVEYQATQSVCGVALPAGLLDGGRLPEPIYTPAFKAPMGEHDENITFERTVELVGVEVATDLRDTSLAIFADASRIAEAKGLILADTKFEFGADDDGTLTLADEVLTPDSSRYWDATLYSTAELDLASRTASFDKQVVRDWLAANWDKTGTPPTLPQQIVEKTAARYHELVARLTK
jgi:phosphoribosylaminoimidazole-succinocarboxamide synthase